VIGSQHHLTHPGIGGRAAKAHFDVKDGKQTRRPVFRHTPLRCLTEMRIDCGLS